MNKLQKWISEKEFYILNSNSIHAQKDVDMAVIKLYVAKHGYNEPAIMSYDFNGGKYGVLMSHKGCARASDAVREYPKAIRYHKMPKRLHAYELYNEKELPEYLLKECKNFLKIYGNN